MLKVKHICLHYQYSFSLSVIQSVSSSKSTAVTPMTTTNVVVPSTPEVTVTKGRIAHCHNEALEMTI